MSTLKKFAGQTAVYGVSTIASRILNFFLTPIYTKVYPKAVYGIFTEMYSYASILNAVLSFGMETTFFRYINKKEGQKDIIYNNTFIVVAFLSLLFLISTLLFIDPIAVWVHDGKATPLADYKTYIKYFIVLLYYTIYIIFFDIVISFKITCQILILINYNFAEFLKLLIRDYKF